MRSCGLCAEGEIGGGRARLRRVKLRRGGRSERPNMVGGADEWSAGLEPAGHVGAGGSSKGVCRVCQWLRLELGAHAVH